jgi:hypothetical protein
MILGSLAAPVVAWRAFTSMSDKPYALAALVIGCIDLALIAIVIASMLLQ